MTIVDEFGVEQVIETTDVHPFWVVTDEPDLSRAARSFADGMYHENLEGNEHGYYVEAKDLRVGDVFLGANGELSTLVATERLVDSIAVFNFRVDGNHNYFILAKEYDYGQTCVLVHNSEPCWDDEGNPIWPPNEGFKGVPEEITLHPGTIIDRYGDPGGSFVAPQGIPFEERSLPPGFINKELHTYEVIADIHGVKAGIAAPWFGQPGGGVQFKLPKPVGVLIDKFLEEIQ